MYVSIVESRYLYYVDLHNFFPHCVTLRGQTKEAPCTSKKQDPALPENRALNSCEACFNWV